MSCCLKALWDQLVRPSDFIPDSASEGLDSSINIWIANTGHCAHSLAKLFLSVSGSKARLLTPVRCFFCLRTPNPIIALQSGFEMSLWCPLSRKLCCMNIQFASPDPNCTWLRQFMWTGSNRFAEAPSPRKRNPKHYTHLVSRRCQPFGKEGCLCKRVWQFEWLCKCHSLKIKMKLSFNSNRSKLKSRVKHLFHEHNSSTVFGTSEWYLFSKW